MLFHPDAILLMAFTFKICLAYCVIEFDKLLTKFHNNSLKIVDLLLEVNF